MLLLAPLVLPDGAQRITTTVLKWLVPVRRHHKKVGLATSSCLLQRHAF